MILFVITAVAFFFVGTRAAGISNDGALRGDVRRHAPSHCTPTCPGRREGMEAALQEYRETHAPKATPAPSGGMETSQ